MSTRQFDQIAVTIYETSEELGRAAARELGAILARAIDARGDAAIVLATGNSQLPFFQALRDRPEIRWDRITVLHMDEYLGMDERHPASFRRYLRERVVDVFHPRAFHGIAGDAPDPEAEAERYAALLLAHDPVATVLGIGENGHIAFNDPPADFTTERLVHVVELDQACRSQQVGEGHFATLDDVPRRALSLTVPALLRPPHVLAIVPERRKAGAVRAALEGPLTPDCPASILRTRPQVRMFLDRDSASLL